MDASSTEDDEDLPQQPSSPPTYRVVLIEEVLKWNLPQEIQDAALSFCKLEPPPHPYR